MDVHGHIVAPYASPRIAFDVASRRRFKGGAETRDIRYSVTLKPPELPWPLTFYFLCCEEDDGTLRWANVGYEFGAPVPRDIVASLDSDDTELTPARVRVLHENFYRYRNMAEELLVGRREEAARRRAAMRKRRGQALTDDFLASFAAEWQAYGGESGAITELATTHRCSRVTVWRWLKAAEQRGFIAGGPR